MANYNGNNDLEYDRFALANNLDWLIRRLRRIATEAHDASGETLPLLIDRVSEAEEVLEVIANHARSVVGGGA